MVALRDLAKQIETQSEAESKALDLKGKNVRGPSLIAEQFYLGKTWKATVEGSDNRYIALRFKGAAHKDQKGERTMLAENPRLIDLGEGDVYIFERYQDGRNTEFEAYGSDACLVFGESAVRLTFFEIVDVTLQTKPEKKAAVRKGAVAKEPVKATKKAAAPKKSATKAVAEKAKEAQPAAETEQATSSEAESDIETTEESQTTGTAESGEDASASVGENDSETEQTEPNDETDGHTADEPTSEQDNAVVDEHVSAEKKEHADIQH